MFCGGSGMSDIYMLKSIGERTPPCETPVLMCFCLCCCVLEFAVCFPDFVVVCCEFLYCCWYVCVVYFVNEGVYVYGVECFAHVKTDHNCS